MLPTSNSAPRSPAGWDSALWAAGKAWWPHLASPKEERKNNAPPSPTHPDQRMCHIPSLWMCHERGGPPGCGIPQRFPARLKKGFREAGREGSIVAFVYHTGLAVGAQRSVTPTRRETPCFFVAVLLLAQSWHLQQFGRRRVPVPRAATPFCGRMGSRGLGSAALETACCSPCRKQRDWPASYSEAADS